MRRPLWLAASIVLCLAARPEAGPAAAPVLRLTSAEFAGGAAVRVPPGELAGLTEARQLGAGARATRAAVRATFDLGATPGGPYAVWLKARAEGEGAPPAVEIVLNGSRIPVGPRPFPREWWELRRFRLPAGALRPRANRLEVRCASAGGNRGVPQALLVAEAVVGPVSHVPVHELTTAYTVDLSLASPAGPAPRPPTGGFAVRGTKGWGWTPEQYLSEIPWLARFGLNFLMNGYTSMYTDAVRKINRWWEPIPDEKKRAFSEIARQCRLNGVEFCFAFHPQLHSERPLKLDDEADFEALWRQYEWMQQAGVNWFSLCFDDIPTRGLDMPALAEGQARVANRLLERLRRSSPSAQLVFCPVTYYGCGDAPSVRPYLEALGRTLLDDVYVFWTGDQSVAPAITRACGETFRSLVRRRLFIWDNYPTNDRFPILHLGPVTGRDPDLTAVAGAYLSNPHAPQHDVNRLPLATCADFAADPAGYDPQASIAEAIFALGRTAAQRDVLAALVELYPGELIYGRSEPNEVLILERFDRLLERPGGRGAAGALLSLAERTLDGLEREFPDWFESTKTTLRAHVAHMQERRR